jgi:hypothetical protein
MLPVVVQDAHIVGAIAEARRVGAAGAEVVLDLHDHAGTRGQHRRSLRTPKSSA